MATRRPAQDRIRIALQEHERSLLRYAANLVGDLDIARDLVQDSFLQLCRQLDGRQLDGRQLDRRFDEHLKEWLYKVCRNRAVDHLRKQGRTAPWTVPLEENGAAEPPPDPAPDPAAVAEHGDETQRLLHRIGRLPARQQEVLRLKFQAHLSYQQISNLTELSVANVGFLLHVALKTLRRQMAGEAENP